MKDYKRLTKRCGDIVNYAKPLQSNFIGAIYEEQKERDSEIMSRLAELEDKIESGELISTKQVGDTEIEFFVNHNENVRKNIAQDIFSWIYKNLVNLNFITGNVEINLSALNDFAKTYGVDVFDIFKQGGKQ